jgi:hypothetical protein
MSQYYSSYFGTNGIELWANYMYLDTNERERFAKNTHEYLIEQVQYVNPDAVGVSSENAPSIIRLQFNHPVKELIWCYQNNQLNASTNLNSMWNFSSSTANVNVTVDPQLLPQNGMNLLPNQVGAPRLFAPALLSGNLYVSGTSNVGTGNTITVQSNVQTGNVFWIESGLPNYGTANTVFGYEVGPLHKFKLMLNGTDRFIEQPGKYFNQYQPYQYHSGAPYVGIYTYSFALKPEELQPSGACNFSRIDMAQVAVSLKSGMGPNLSQKMFAVNYNVLKVASGMGGLVFSN